MQDKRFVTDFSAFTGGKKRFTGQSEDGKSVIPAEVRSGDKIGAILSKLEESSSEWGKVGRNDVCPCGSGKKFKHCHGSFVAKAGGAGR